MSENDKARLKANVATMRANLRESKRQFERGEISGAQYMERKRDVNRRIAEINREMGTTYEEEDP